MKEIFEDVYNITDDIMHGFGKFLIFLFDALWEIFLFITTPIWFLPCKIYKELKRRDENG